MDPSYAPTDRLYRDTERRWIAGVLAGAAQHFGWNLTVLRLAVFLVCLTPVVPLVFVVYVLAALILPKRRQVQMTLPPPPGAEEWQSYVQSPRVPCADQLRIRVREMEDSLRSIEAYVTSSQYEIDRELKRRPE